MAAPEILLATEFLYYILIPYIIYTPMYCPVIGFLIQLLVNLLLVAKALLLVMFINVYYTVIMLFFLQDQ